MFTKLRTEQFIREEMEQTAKQGTEYGYRYILHRGYNIY
jgi:hypothetical protein